MWAREEGACSSHTDAIVFSPAACVFDLVILVATVARLLRIQHENLWGHHARMHRWLWTSSMIYFSVTTAVNLSCFLAELLVKDAVLSQIPTSIAFVIHVVVASRLVLASKGEWSASRRKAVE